MNIKIKECFPYIELTFVFLVMLAISLSVYSFDFLSDNYSLLLKMGLKSGIQLTLLVIFMASSDSKIYLKVHICAKDFLWFLPLFIAFFLAAWLPSLIFPNNTSFVIPKVNSIWSFFASAFVALVIGFSEELLYRQYAICVIADKTGYCILPTIISVVIFCFGHSSQGLSGIVAAAIIGICCSFAIIKGAKFQIIALAHACYDLLAFLPL